MVSNGNNAMSFRLTLTAPAKFSANRRAAKVISHEVTGRTPMAQSDASARIAAILGSPRQ